MIYLDDSSKERATKIATRMLSYSSTSSKPALNPPVEGDLKNLAVCFLKLVDGKHPFGDVVTVVASGRMYGKNFAHATTLAEKLFREWAAQPNFEPIDEDMALNLVSRIRDLIVGVLNGRDARKSKG